MKKSGKDGRPTAAALKEEVRLQKLYSKYRGVDDDYVHAGRAALERFHDWKFGIRIHWGLYAVTGIHAESWSLIDLEKRNIHNGPKGAGDPEYRENYERIYKWWNPGGFDAGEWCDLFARAGLKFFTFTAKHHDGFSLYDTGTKVVRRLVHTGKDAGKIVPCNLRYSIMETPFKRDVLGELVVAGRRRKLGIGIYFSHGDWFDSDFRFDPWGYQASADPKHSRKDNPEGVARAMARHREQIRELCSNYGKVDIFSFDLGFGNDEEWAETHNCLGIKAGVRQDIIETVKMARRLQPEMLMRERGIGSYGDYHTPEGFIPKGSGGKSGADMPWKVIYPGGKFFSFVWLDEYKRASWIIESLVDIVAKGGCFQVGYGPTPEGRWSGEVVRRLEEVGRWLKVNGEGIYATRPCKQFCEGDSVRFTRSKDGRHTYAFLLKWQQKPFTGGTVSIQSLRARPGSPVRMLGLGHDFKYHQDSRGLHIQIPDWFADPARRPCETAWAFKIKTLS